MSITTTGSNVEIVKGMYESFAEGDIEAVAATWAPDIEMNEAAGLVHGGTFHGADKLIEDVFSVMGTVWEDVSVVPDRFIADGDTVVVFHTWSGTSIETGKDVEFPGVHVL
ncbi:MAG: nuclear transport factor 2 family protein, partial [Halodesulfurarchaeum sp.]|nr:nuclear transport factor 2 family protein [Halodesulfurarchaeum sp.]